MYTLMAAVVSLGLTAGMARGQSAKDELDARAHNVNALADKHGGMKQAIHDVSVETGVSEGELQRMHDAHSDVGAAGLLIACVLADNTKKSPEQFLSHHVNGKGWAALAHDNNVPIDKINRKLDNLERELNGYTPTGRDRGYPDNRGYDYRK